MKVTDPKKQASAKLNKNQGIDINFEKPVVGSNDLHDEIIKLQDEFDAIEEVLNLTHEVSNQWLSGEMELSIKQKNGLIGLLDLVSREATNFQFRLSQLNQKPLQRFIHMVLRNSTLVKYFDKKKCMIDMKQLWEDFPDMTEAEKVLVTFMIMVWNPPAHKFPKTKPYKALCELRHLSKAERQLILDWASDPFYVNDDKGRLNHQRNFKM